jgi:hypothetical protein
MQILQIFAQLHLVVALFGPLFEQENTPRTFGVVNTRYFASS